MKTPKLVPRVKLSEAFLLSAHSQVSTAHDGHISPFRPEVVAVGGPGCVGDPTRPMFSVDLTHGALRAGRYFQRKALSHG